MKGRVPGPHRLGSDADRGRRSSPALHWRQETAWVVTWGTWSRQECQGSHCGRSAVHEEEAALLEWPPLPPPLWTSTLPLPPGNKEEGLPTRWSVRPPSSGVDLHRQGSWRNQDVPSCLILHSTPTAAVSHLHAHFPDEETEA